MGWTVAFVVVFCIPPRLSDPTRSRLISFETLISSY